MYIRCPDMKVCVCEVQMSRPLIDPPLDIVTFKKGLTGSSDADKMSHGADQFDTGWVSVCACSREPISMVCVCIVCDSLIISSPKQ